MFTWFSLPQLAKLDMAEVISRINSVKSPPRGGAARAARGGGGSGVARRVSLAECVEHWGAEKPFDSLSDYMMERTMPVRTGAGTTRGTGLT